MSPKEQQEQEKQEAYRVLARKYRPQNFDDLIGQDALVRTLKNAIDSGRIAHAFMLTGIRGVGKTTTARIIAKALNYTGADGNAEPTTGDTSDCETCKAIAEDRHPDVMEMDAASRTGIDDIREILDGVRYAPTSARYKIYIIDEVHMLSKAAFNALLKTLEEPPEHVKFIFATTEIRKVPITSLLDQSIALGDGSIDATQVKNMLGLADRALILDVIEAALKGTPSIALEIMDDLYKKGADPIVVLQDMLEISHMLTKHQNKDMTTLPKGEQERLENLADSLSMPSLGRTWQILLKGLGEVNIAPNPQKAAEMVVIRLIYAADLPDPADLIKKIKAHKDTGAMPPQGVSNTATSAAPVAQLTTTPAQPPSTNVNAAQETTPQETSGQATAALAQTAPDFAQINTDNITSMEDIVALLEQNGDMILAMHVRMYAHLVNKT